MAHTRNEFKATKVQINQGKTVVGTSMRTSMGLGKYIKHFEKVWYVKSGALMFSSINFYGDYCICLLSLKKKKNVYDFSLWHRSHHITYLLWVITSIDLVHIFC